MGNDSCSVNETSGSSEIKPPESTRNDVAKESADFDLKKDDAKRKTERLNLIKRVIHLCFISLGVMAIIIFLDLIWFKRKVYDSPFFIVLVAIISTTLTTALGAVIGSSID